MSFDAPFGITAADDEVESVDEEDGSEGRETTTKATRIPKIWMTTNERASPLVHIDEPLLEFRFGQKLVYPRDGLFLYGPVDGGGRGALRRDRHACRPGASRALDTDGGRLPAAAATARVRG